MQHHRFFFLVLSLVLASPIIEAAHLKQPTKIYQRRPSLTCLNSRNQGTRFHQFYRSQPWGHLLPKKTRSAPIHHMPIKHFYKFQNFSKKYLASSTLDNTSEPESKKTIDVLREAFAEQNHPLVQEFFNLLSLDSSLWKKKEVPTDLSRRRKKNLKGSYKPYSEAQLSYLYTDGMVLSNHSMEINGKKYKIIFRFGLRIIPTVYFDCVRNIDKDAHRTETLPPGYFANANVDRFTFQEGNNKEIKISYQSVSPTLEYVEEEPTLKSTLGVFSLIPIDSDLNI